MIQSWLRGSTVDRNEHGNAIAEHSSLKSSLLKVSLVGLTRQKLDNNCADALVVTFLPLCSV